MRKLLLLIFWVSLVLTVASFGGAVHGIGDSLAVFRYWWAIALSLSSVLLLRGHLRLAGLGLMAVVLAAAPMAAGYFWPNGAEAGGYTFYQKNLLFKNDDLGGITEDILSVSPDFVTLQEVSHENRAVFDALAGAYPSSLICEFASVGQVAVLSKFPIIAGSETCFDDNGPAAIRVMTPDGPLWVVALHLHWPFPYGQKAQMDELVSQMSFLSGPVVLGGDFNMVPWSYTMRRLEAVTGSLRAGPVVNTYFNETLPLRIPIDHIMVPSGQGTLETRPFLGSDHLGLLLRFDL